MRRSEARRAVAAALLALAGAGLAVAYAFGPDDPGGRAAAVDAALAGAFAVSGWAALDAARTGRAWEPARWFGVGLLGLALAFGLVLARDAAGLPAPPPGLADLGLLPIAAAFLLPARAEFVAHVEERHRR
ncbi:MAG TPA: hypothetical protein VNO79_01970, partial [Actinomycetota bacterium]|nr:hypothetical protein [Actinomycetota bacterium]